MRTATTARRGALALFATAMVAVMGASFAWACSATPQVWFKGSGSSAAGRPTETVTLYGSEWEKTGGTTGPVELRWNSATAKPFASAEGPSFSVEMTVPDVRPDVYTIYFTQASVNGGVARASFEVLPASRPAADPADNGEPARDTKTSGSGSGAESTQGSGGQRSATTSGGTSQPSEETNAGQPPARTTGGSGGVQSFPTPKAAAPSDTAETGTTSVAPVAGVRPGAVATPSGQVVFGGSVAAPARSASPAPASAPAVADEQAAPASARVASGDLWSGFAPGTRTSLMPSLLDSPASSTPGPAGPLALTAALAGAGLVALFGGFALAELRRKRVLSHTT